MASSGDQSAGGGLAARASKLRYPLRSASKGRAAASPTISAPRSDKSAKPPWRHSVQTKPGAMSTTRCKFSTLSSISYWMSQIRLAETASKHSVSLGFFKLALESECEPVDRMRNELKAYVVRHGLATELEDSVKDILHVYDFVEDFEKLKISDNLSQQPKKSHKAARATTNVSPNGNLKPRSLNSDATQKKEAGKKNIQKTKPVKGSYSKNPGKNTTSKELVAKNNRKKTKKKTKEQQDVCGKGGEALAASSEQEPDLAFVASTMASHSTCSRADAEEGVVRLVSVLLLDALLGRLSAKDLCLLRAVCRPLCSLLSDPQFIAQHPNCHSGPLIVVGYSKGRFICDIMDLSGRVVKSVRATLYERVVSIQQELVCTAIGTGRPTYRLRNPVTGAVDGLPQGFSKWHAARERGISSYKQFVVLGYVASTGQYKVLRILQAGFRQQLCEVYTHDGHNHASWRAKKAPPSLVQLDSNRNTSSSVAVNGIVYFLSCETADYKPSFNLETEDWKQTLCLPPLSSQHHADWLSWLGVSLATRSGCLVVVDGAETRSSALELWFLKDSEKGLWVKQYSIKPTSDLHFKGGSIGCNKLISCNLCNQSRQPSDLDLMFQLLTTGEPPINLIIFFFRKHRLPRTLIQNRMV